MALSCFRPLPLFFDVLRVLNLVSGGTLLENLSRLVGPPPVSTMLFATGVPLQPKRRPLPEAWEQELERLAKNFEPHEKLKT